MAPQSSGLTRVPDPAIDRTVTPPVPGALAGGPGGVARIPVRFSGPKVALKTKRPVGVTVIAVLTFAGVYAALRFTRWGLVARATMDNPTQASVLGISPSRVYTVTFAAGAALSGLAGAVFAPVSGVLPTICVTALPTGSPRWTSRRAP